ncbi:hypothetical protein BGI32_07885 [Snodgrassella alvi]|uniref:4-hydroxybenzoate polyprenyltransferase n=1 Tax=Snodgrassella alvi TaxID=1196083 RepID=A0A2N9WT00_9NEIS|nr:hypothetical protein BGI32_07885 [Snodgrassella alvi]
MVEQSNLPLVVDLDGTLILTDSLHESLINMLKLHPFEIFRLIKVYFLGKAEFKKFVYERSDFKADNLPYCHELIEYIQHERQQGRKIILATAAYKQIAYKISDFLQCFDEVIATDAQNNLKGVNKFKAIEQKIGREFIYIGDDYADLPIWKEASGAIIVGSKVNKLTRKVSQTETPILKELSNDSTNVVTWLKAIRLHQWLKNILLLVPLLTAFQFYDLHKLFLVAIAFIAFSLGASATYILNDLWDLDNDREHSSKKNRPFASGRLSIAQGIKASILLLLSAVFISVWISWFFLSVFLLYLFITTLYSLRLKQVVLLDIIILSVLYTIRIFAGGVVIHIDLSYALLAFSVLIFLSLATVKRCAELVSMHNNKSLIAGRGYMKSDLDILWPLGISTYIGAIILFGLYINAPETIVHYKTPALLWLVQLFMIYLIGNLWVMTKRGLMHDDPIVFFIQDKKSLILLVLIICVILLARYL